MSKVEVMCNNCKKWSISSGNLNERCQHCNTYLYEKEIENIRKRKVVQINQRKNKEALFQIDKKDSELTKKLKKLGYKAHLTFFGIVIALVLLTLATHI